MSVIKKRSGSRYFTKDGYSYLTKRLVISRARNAGRAAAEKAMSVMGFVVTVKDGWLVKEYANGSTEQLQKIA